MDVWFFTVVLCFDGEHAVVVLELGRVAEWCSRSDQKIEMPFAPVPVYSMMES